MNRCSVLGHEFGETEIRRDRDRHDEEVVVTIRELRTCDRCGERQVVSENRKVRTVEPSEQGAKSDSGSKSEPGTGSQPDEAGGQPDSSRTATSVERLPPGDGKKTLIFDDGSEVAPLVGGEALGRKLAADESDADRSDVEIEFYVIEWRNSSLVGSALGTDPDVPFEATFRGSVLAVADQVVLERESFSGPLEWQCGNDGLEIEFESEWLRPRFELDVLRIDDREFVYSWA